MPGDHLLIHEVSSARQQRDLAGLADGARDVAQRQLRQGEAAICNTGNRRHGSDGIHARQIAKRRSGKRIHYARPGQRKNRTRSQSRVDEVLADAAEDHLAQQKEIERLQRMVDRFKGKPTKVSMARSKQKAIEHMEIIEAPDRYDNKTFHAHFQPAVETGNDVLFVSNLEIGYEQALSTVTVDLKRGEKLGILGGKGLGKSTFLKTIVDKIPALSGEYKYGVNVQIGYFDQQMAMYQSNKTVLDDYWDEFPNLTETEVRNALGAFLFTGEDVFKNISMLSGGEKAFVAIAIYFAILKVRPTPFVVMDEIDAALDDSNVVKFARYLRKMAQKTQFVVITHRRGTMEEADVLYGVTMQEQGVSRMLTINLKEAEEKFIN